LAVGPGLSYLAQQLPQLGLRSRMIERITVGKSDQQLEYLHRARYEFAKPYCAGKRVADIAAGEGYGTAMLREVAASVDGYDKVKFGDNLIIDLEKEKWAPRYDVIVSLETVEHLANPDFFLRNISESCDLAIISTPIGEPRGFNPFHKQTWTALEFEQLLERFFSCEYHSQEGNQFPLDNRPPQTIVAVCQPVARPE
jgi:2-polyprenyl-3-methyl-5-hydroxy-6-metoxy-1,4-benzoquinol methylase